MCVQSSKKASTKLRAAIGALEANEDAFIKAADEVTRITGELPAAERAKATALARLATKESKKTEATAKNRDHAVLARVSRPLALALTTGIVRTQQVTLGLCAAPYPLRVSRRSSATACRGTRCTPRQGYPGCIGREG